MEISKEVPQYDVAIIGGGPAGSTAAAYLASNKISCVVLEKEKFPRAHVGESLVPSSTRIFRELDFLKKMEEAGFVKKYGAVWTSVTNKIYGHDFDNLHKDYEVDIEFRERKQEGVNQNYTYHVDRGKFDQLLLQHAGELGANIFEETQVIKFNFDSPSFVKLTLAGNGKPSESIDVKFVVDASGRRCILGSVMGLKQKDPVFDQCAMHCWFENYDRGQLDKDNFIFIHFLPIRNGWIWQIPISERITSIGLVTQKKDFESSKEKREDFFWETLKSRPELYKRLKKSRQVNEFKVEGDYSYEMTRFIGDRFILVGDAARFVDPIFSSGVSIAMQSAKFGAEAIIEAFKKNDLSEKQFKNYETTIKGGCRTWYRFIQLYYRLNVLFTYFVENPEYRLDVLRLLQGDVYDEEPELLDKMEKIVKEVESNPKHIWHPLLGNFD